MKIAVEGCAHGELEKIYDSIQHLENKENIKIDLLICCGDFQSTRNITDLRCMACPIKYQNICTFYKYYNGEKIAPILTVFIGGNHEASNYLQELPYGGWVAPNIYYMGYANVINVGGIRIGGISGIYKGHDFLRGHFEQSPYTEDTKRSVYHIRNLEVYRLKQLSGNIDIFLSHDWPRGVYHYGNVDELLKYKPYFRDDIFENKLGSKPCEDLLHHLKPNYWFSAHLHCKFAALVPHRIDKISEDCDTKQKNTKFLALDKCLPKRKFLQIIDISSEQDITHKCELSYDLEWLTILHLTNHLLNVKSQYQYMPDSNTSSKERSNFTPTNEEKQMILEKFNNNLIIPLNFQQTVEAYNPNSSKHSSHRIEMPNAQTNIQTEEFCKKLGIDDPLHLVLLNNSNNDSNSSDNCSLPNFLTPERNANQTYSEYESFMFIPLSVERNSYKRLSLPAPKDTSISVESTDDDIKKLSNEISSDDSKIDKNKSDSCSTQNSNDNNLNSSPQPIKKFKRRNASLYENL